MLAGTHSLSSASHISLILYKTFNVSIPINNIPLDEYEFDEDVSAAEIRETDGEVLDSDEEDSSDEEDDDEDSEGVAAAKEEIIETGRWRNKRTGKLLGAGGEEIAFTVTGYVFGFRVDAGTPC
jgi:DNA-directed RNA polymerase I subunit RPA43